MSLLLLTHFSDEWVRPVTKKPQEKALFAANQCVSVFAYVSGCLYVSVCVSVSLAQLEGVLW